MNENQFAAVLLGPSEAETVYQYLVRSGANELAEMILEKGSRDDLDRNYASMVELWDDSEFSIDEDPVVAKTQDGAFVMIWQWVSNQPEDDTEM